VTGVKTLPRQTLLCVMLVWQSRDGVSEDQCMVLTEFSISAVGVCSATVISRADTYDRRQQYAGRRCLTACLSIQACSCSADADRCFVSEVKHVLSMFLFACIIQEVNSDMESRYISALPAIDQSRGNNNQSLRHEKRRKQLTQYRTVPTDVVRLCTSKTRIMQY